MFVRPSTRRRSSETLREADRLSSVVAINLGRTVKAGRLRLGLQQKQLAARVNVTQAWISRIELGHGDRVPLRTWVAIGTALRQPLAISFTRPLTQMREPADAGHLSMQERLLELARATARAATFELPTRPADPRHSIDVCVRDSRHRVLIIWEIWNTFGDIGAAIRSTNRKRAEALTLAAIVDAGPPYRVATVWVVRPTAANRALIARYPEIFHSGFPGSSRLWVKALETGAVPPDRPGLVWLDPASGRLTEWRRAG
jgi:transcriptional regulator with XRE-family HTH domain